MKTLVLLLGSVALLTACATTKGVHETVSSVGRITEKEPVKREPMDNTGVYRPGQGGAIGGLAAGLIVAYGGKPPHTKYVLLQKDGSYRIVPSIQEIEVGVCVAVMVDASNQRKWTLQLGEATLKQSDACT